MKSDFEVQFDTTIIEMFKSCCDLILKKDIDDSSFEFCKDTIYHTMSYLSSKRHRKNHENETSH